MWTVNSMGREITARFLTYKRHSKFSFPSAARDQAECSLPSAPDPLAAKQPLLASCSSSPGAMERTVKFAVAQKTKAKERSGLPSSENLLLPGESYWSALKWGPTSSRGKLLTDGLVGRGCERLQPGPWGYLQQLQMGYQCALSGYSADAKHLLVQLCILTFYRSSGRQLPQECALGRRGSLGKVDGH